MPVKKPCSVLLSLVKGPQKSVCNSSFGSTQLGNGDHLLGGITSFM